MDCCRELVWVGVFVSLAYLAGALLFYERERLMGVAIVGLHCLSVFLHVLLIDASVGWGTPLRASVGAFSVTMLALSFAAVQTVPSATDPLFKIHNYFHLNMAIVFCVVLRAVSPGVHVLSSLLALVVLLLMTESHFARLRAPAEERGDRPPENWVVRITLSDGTVPPAQPSGSESEQETEQDSERESEQENEQDSDQEGGDHQHHHSDRISSDEDEPGHAPPDHPSGDRKQPEYDDLCLQRE